MRLTFKNNRENNDLIIIESLIRGNTIQYNNRYGVDTLLPWKFLHNILISLPKNQDDYIIKPIIRVIDIIANNKKWSIDSLSKAQKILDKQSYPHPKTHAGIAATWARDAAERLFYIYGITRDEEARVFSIDQQYEFIADEIITAVEHAILVSKTPFDELIRQESFLVESMENYT